MLPKFNKTIPYEALPVYPEDFKYMIYLLCPMHDRGNIPYLYVTNGKKKKRIFYDRLVKIGKEGVLDNPKNLKIPFEDIEKIKHLININYEVISNCWTLKQSNGMIEFGKDFIWEW